MRTFTHSKYVGRSARILLLKPVQDLFFSMTLDELGSCTFKALCVHIKVGICIVFGPKLLLVKIVINN